jgi:AraC-like DNA-binding protein/quercetin dioxygenase-like cupin family protein
MSQREWSVLQHDPGLRLDALQAVFTTHAFARHWHDYYVIGLVAAGVQTFSYRRSTYLTPPGGIILLNPGEAHTGEAAAGAGGFAYRALYPTAEHLAPLMAELGRPGQLPGFPSARVDDAALAAQIGQFHDALRGGDAPIARETRWLTMLATLITRYGAERLTLPVAGREPRAIVRAQAYLEAHAAEPITLADLAAHAGLSAFHLVRCFRRALGVPPHAYLESVRIARAQRLIAAGTPLAEIAYAIGYSSQSHFTTRFRKIIGVTPGRYRATL